MNPRHGLAISCLVILALPSCISRVPKTPRADYLQFTDGGARGLDSVGANAAAKACGNSAVDVGCRINMCEAFLSRVGSRIRPPAASVVSGVGMLPEFEAEPAAFRRLFFSDADVAAVKAELATLDLDHQPQRAFQIYLDHRLAHYPSWVRYKINKIVARAIVEDEDTISGAMVGLTDVLYLLRPRSLHNTIPFFALLVHEVEHMIQKSEIVLKIVSKERDNYFLEFGAVRSEWEFLRLFPESSIENAGRLVREAKLTDYHRRNTSTLLGLSSASFADYRAKHLYHSRLGTEEYYRGRRQHEFDQ